MPVSGLVVTFSDDKLKSDQAFVAIEINSQISIGPRKEKRMAIVLDTDSSLEDRILWDWLTALPGILFVDVVFVGFENADNEMATVPI